MESSCSPQMLVASEACEVHLCPDCGTVHLSMGPVSLRLREHHFEQVAENLREALFKLQRIRNPDDFSSAEIENITRIHS